MRRLWNFITDKRQLSMRDRNSDEVHWKMNISPIGLWGGIATFVLLIIIILMLLMSHTSILYALFPSYRTKVDKMHDEMVEKVMRVDSLERQIAMTIEYNEAVVTIMRGSTPTLQSTIGRDTIRYDKSLILPTRADTLLRAAIENTTGEYSLTNTKPSKSVSARFNSPMYGTITRDFDAPDSDFDILIMSLSGENSVVSIADGTVMRIESMNGYSTVIIHHSDGYVSTYKGLSEVLVRKGQRVSSDSVIGRIGSLAETNGEDDANSNLHLAFELWRDGSPLNPTSYIDIEKSTVGNE